jgi:dihydropteroate synthase
MWNCRDKKIVYDKKTLLMGIVNVTPDSFSDGGAYFDAKKALEHALLLEEQGADILDIGAQSTRPGYKEISADEEWMRLKGVLKPLRAQTKLPISVDTYYPEVAEKVLEEGADIINDVSGRLSKEMAGVIKKYGAGWVIMHSGEGSPAEVKIFFEKALDFALKNGIKKEQLCLDAGIGFGKTEEQNLRLITEIEKYKIEGVPLLLGFSRKRIIGAISAQTEPEKRIFGNIAADTAAVLRGVNILRLHDVKNEIQGIRAAEALKRYFYG